MSDEKEQSERDRRRAICEACPMLRRELIKRCGHCGCVIAIMTTLNGRCPEKKW